MKTSQSDVLKVDHHQSSLLNNNRLFSSAQNIEGRQKHLRKNSDQTVKKQRKQSISQIRQAIEQDLIGQKFQNDTKLFNKKKISSQSVNENFQPVISIQVPKNQQQEVREAVQQDQRRDYLSNKVTPTLNKMLVKIINHKPNDILGFMIDFLKSEEDKYEKKRFNDQPSNNAIKQDKHIQQVFGSTVASKFIKFKK